MTTRSAKNGTVKQITGLSRHKVIRTVKTDVDGQDKPGHDGHLQERRTK
jgi:hypothetical protein